MCFVMQKIWNTSEIRHGLVINTVLSDAGNSAYAVIKIYRFSHEYRHNLLITELSTSRGKGK